LSIPSPPRAGAFSAPGLTRVPKGACEICTRRMGPLDRRYYFERRAATFCVFRADFVFTDRPAWSCRSMRRCSVSCLIFFQSSILFSFSRIQSRACPRKSKTDLSEHEHRLFKGVALAFKTGKVIRIHELTRHTNETSHSNPGKCPMLIEWMVSSHTSDRCFSSEIDSCSDVMPFGAEHLMW